MTIVYLHGMHSSPEGTKGKSFKRLFHGEEFVAPNMGEDFTSSTFTDKFNLAANVLPYGCFLIGSSLGGYIGALLAEKYPDQIKRLVLLAPAIDFLNRNATPGNYSGVPVVNCPTLVIAGRNDDVVPRSVIETFVDKNPGCEYLLLPHADHRMHEQMRFIRDYVKEFFKRT